MTRKERRVLLYIQDRLDQGVSVSVAEIVRDLGLASTGHAYQFLTVLRRSGHLTWIPRRARSLKVVHRVTPIVEHMVWDDAKKQLVPLREMTNG